MTYAIGTARLLPLTLTLALSVAAIGCETTPIVPPRDAGNDAGFSLPDGVVPCMTDTDCDDHITCTRDTCLPGVMVCAHTGDDTVCDDDIFCNGREVCDFFEGCLAVRTHETCDDGNVCTLDRCDEATKTCEHVARDLDQDGDPDFFCEGGNDCDDRDPTRSGLAPELCDDLEDNDCDGVADEGSLGDAGADVGPRDGGAGSCGRPPHDTCADPLEIASSGVTSLLLGGATADYTLSCFGVPRPDVVVSLTLTEARDVRLTAEGDLSATSMALRNTCTDGTTQLDCSYSFPAEIRRRNMQAGTYYIIIQGSGEVLLDVELLPSMPPTNETCAAPILIPATGGHFSGSFLDVANDLSLTCSPGSNPDLVYQIDLPTESDLTVGLTTPAGQYMTWEVRPTCAVSTGSIRCAQGSPASGTVHQLPAGTYFIVIEGPTRPAVDFMLDVHVGPPTPRVQGDLCATAIPVTLGTPYAGTLSGAEDDINTSCGYNAVDVTHTFTVTATSDLEILVEGSTLYTLYLSLRTACDVGGSQLRCVSGRPISSHVRGIAPGTYYLVLESQRTGSYTLTVNATTPPTIPTPTSGNETCGSPTLIPATGGFWSGTTAASVSDYDPMPFCGAGTPANDVAFRLDLATRSRVTATTEGSSFDTILYRMVGSCRTRMDAICDDDGAGSGGASLLSEMLDPGTYFYIVDGFATGYQGNYEFQVFISPVP